MLLLVFMGTFAKNLNKNTLFLQRKIALQKKTAALIWRGVIVIVYFFFSYFSFFLKFIDLKQNFVVHIAQKMGISPVKRFLFLLTKRTVRMLLLVNYLMEVLTLV